MRLKTTARVLGCLLTIVAAARPADATPLLTTNPADLAGATLIDFEDLTVAAITDQYAPLGVTFSAGLHAEITFPPLVPGGIWGSIAATNGDPSCCPAITMSFSNPLKAMGFQIVSATDAVTTLDVYTELAGVQTFAGQLVLDTAFEVKFFGVLANLSDANPLFDSIVITTLTPPAPGTLSGFVFDNLQFEPVPEPASLTLLGAGAMGLLARVRRSRRNAASRSTC